MPEAESQVVEAIPEAQSQDDGMSFEEAMNLALQSSSQEPDIPDEFTESAEEPQDENQDEAPQQEPVVEAATEEQPESEPEEQPKNKSLARIMEREQKLLEREQMLEAVQPELESLRTRVEAFENAQSRFSSSPVDFIRSLAPDADLKRLAETLWYESQGEKAPQAYLEKKAATQHNSELVERIAKIEQGEQERQRQAYQYEAQRAVAQYHGSLTAFAESVTQESFPHLAVMQEKNPGWVAENLLEAARSHARRTNGQVMTPEQAAKAVDEYIASFQVSSQQQQQPKAPEAQKKNGASLRNNSTQVQPDREPEDELSDEYLRRKAFEAIGISGY